MARPFDKDKGVTVAREILAACKIPLGADFHTLRSSQVDKLLQYAGSYRKPPYAGGSRGRCYHDMLQRKAQRVLLSDAFQNLRNTG